MIPSTTRRIAATFTTGAWWLCVGYDLLFPGHAMNAMWLRLLAGFTWLSWGSFMLGLIEFVRAEARERST